ncbi:hypothetical protein E4650_10110 [Geotoga petraea]|uniref:Abortive infection protein-like C-terminal domain-containing protein n=2 Tax=Geotoga petraea TaxID=28234 RepID=A0A4Z0VSB3_9BACT|nr:abortive infection family protein [Geotoga petraea]TGG86657.1 hypothetical protein E4650_10110 [Geotoga petraea]
MSKMKPIEQAIIEDLFEMGDGWILDFNNDSLQKFVKKSIDINIYKDENYTDYKSKAKKMKQIFEEESDKKVAKLLKDLIEYYEGYAYKNKKENRKEEIDEINKVIGRLSKAEGFSIDVQNNISWKKLEEEIEYYMKKDNYEFILDRLHTFTVKFLKYILEKHNIQSKNQKNNNLPLHSLIGNLKNYYIENNAIDSEFSLKAISINISLFEKFNDIRNNKSYAHDNIILNKIESEFVIRNIINTINFISNIETINEEKEFHLL